MGCSPFPNSHFQMGVTAMGFAEDFGLRLKSDVYDTIWSNQLRIYFPCTHIYSVAEFIAHCFSTAVVGEQRENNMHGAIFDNEEHGRTLTC